MKKLGVLLTVLCLCVVGLVGCGSNKPSDQVGEVSLEKPLYVDKKDKSVTVLCKVNGKYFTEPTRHASVYEKGSNGQKSIFTAYAKPDEFFEAVKEIGGKPGENMTPENAINTHVEGTPIKVTVTWNGADKEYEINEVVKDSNGKKIDFRFGGNKERAIKKDTGCLSCLDSCPVGIISNSTYTYGAVEKRKEVGFTGNDKVLPEDGTYVAVKYQLHPDCCED